MVITRFSNHKRILWKSSSPNSFPAFQIRLVQLWLHASKSWSLQDGHSSPLELAQCCIMMLVRKLLPMFYLNMPMCCLFGKKKKKSCNVHTLWWMIFHSLWCVNCQLCPRSGGMLWWAEQKVQLQHPILFIKNVERSGDAHQA